MKLQHVLRWFVRLCFLALAIFLIMGGPLPQAVESQHWLRRVVPALSPLVAFSETLSQRGWYLGIFWLLPPVAILGMAIWRGRWFCRWLCPAGTSYGIASAITHRKKNIMLLRWRLAPVLFFAIIFASILGLPQFLSFDPLSSFGRIAGGVSHNAAWIPGLVVPIFLIASLFQPMIWCTHVCPLGYGFGLVHSLVRKPRKTFSHERRGILLGLAIGVPVAVVLPKIFRRKTIPILPPGAGDVTKFSAACTRCYACVAACPAKIITVRATGGISELFIPEVDLKAGTQICAEECNACTLVCPTGAIKQLTLKQKQHVQIAKAKVVRENCIAWSNGATCMVCDEYCPYSAIDTVYAPDDKFQDIPLPVVNSDRCRGCGYCRAACVSPNPETAIKILPVERQKKVNDEQ